MIYELKVYDAVEGRFEAMRDRFITEAMPRLNRYGIQVIGVFQETDTPGRLYYITRSPDEAARSAGWARFYEDPEWKQVKSQTEADGPLMASQETTILNAMVSDVLLS